MPAQAPPPGPASSWLLSAVRVVARGRVAQAGEDTGFPLGIRSLPPPWASSVPQPLRDHSSPCPSADLSLSGPPQKLPPKVQALRPQLAQGAGTDGRLEKAKATELVEAHTVQARDGRAWRFGKGRSVLPASSGTSGPPRGRCHQVSSRCEPRTRLPARSMPP